MGSTFLGIDLGTSSVKVVLIDENKQVLQQAGREYEAQHPLPGWSEIDPGIWYDCMMDCLGELFRHQDASLVRAVGVTGQMHTVVVLDADGKPVRPAIMWNDTRTHELIPDLKKTFSGYEEGKHLAGIVSTGSPAANLYWISREEPEHFRKIRKFVIGPDYLVYRLTGRLGTDYCEASTSSMYQIRAQKWSEEVRDLIGLEEDVYPRVGGSCQPAGVILPEICSRIGFARNVPVITGTGDNPASAVSTGCLGRGYPVLSLGTSGVLMMPLSSPDDTAKGKVILFSEDGSRISYLVQGVVQSTGESVTWWTRKVLGVEDLKRFSDGLEALSGDSGKPDMPSARLLFYPHLAGDKTIYGDPNMKGAFIGLSADTTAEDMFYAVMEGVSFAFRQLMEEMHMPKCRTLKVVGGGARSNVWMQTLANILNVRIERMEGMMGPGFGIALLAMKSVLKEHSMETLADGAVRVERTFVPQGGSVEKCSAKYRSYLRIRTAMKYIEEGADAAGLRDTAFSVAT